MNEDDIGGYAEFAQAEPRHYDRVPSIIDHLTYIHEEIDPKTGKRTYTRKRLTPTEKEFYRILRYRAGNGACWRKTDDLADHVGCSKNTITQAKKALSMPFEQLEGNPLIYIKEKMVMTVRDGQNINKRPVHVITIGDIWRFNNAFMDSYNDAAKKRKLQKEQNERNEELGLEPIPVDEERKYPARKQPLSTRDGELAVERLSQPGPVKLVHNLGAPPKKCMSPKAPPKKSMSPPGSSSQNWDVNKYLLNKDHCLKTNTKANALARCFLDKSIVEECFESEHKAIESLQKFGLKINKASKLVREHTLDELILSFIYVKDRLKKKLIKSSVVGYFLNTLEKRWYTANLH